MKDVGSALSSQETFPEDDALTFGDIVERIWRGRWLLVIIPVFVGMAASILFALSALQVNRPVLYYIDLTNISDERYPNGTPFAPSDLMIPEVRAELRRRFDLPAEPPLTEVINVSYGSPRAAGVVRSFEQRLGSRNLSTPEIESINQRYSQELRSVVGSSLAIRVDYQHLGIAAHTAMALARAVPEIWSEIYNNNFRVYNDTRLAEASVSRSQEDLETTASVLVANTRLKTMRRGLELIARDNRLRSVLNSDGSTAEDMIQELHAFRGIFFNSIMAEAFRSDDAVARLYLAELRLDTDNLRRKLTGIDETMEELRRYHGAARLPEMAETISEREQIQLGDGAVTQIIQMSERASFAAFVQQLLRDRQATLFQISEIERQLDLANGNLATTNSSAVRETASRILADVTRQYVDLLARARQVLSTRGGDFFVSASGPMVVGPSMIDRRGLMMVGVAGVAGLVLAVLLVLVWPAIREIPRQRAAQRISS